MQNRIIKTRAAWSASRQPLNEFFSPGDLVDDAVYEYFLSVLPPACWRSNIVQIGEAVDTVGGLDTYATLEKTWDGWVYRGDCWRGKFTKGRSDWDSQSLKGLAGGAA